tara:strand:- start:226 stop:1974 length:1749 start_codon:yes stop_codon:yes gene_type:complete
LKNLRQLKYSEILKYNKVIGSNLKSKPYKISVLSNTIINQIKEILEYPLRCEGISANVTFGGYDNIVQDSIKYCNSNTVIIFWELCNIIDGFEYKVETLNDESLNAFIDKTKSEIDLVLKALEKTSLVIFNRFTSLQFRSSNIRKSNLDKVAYKLNQFIESRINPNVKLFDLEKVIARIGLEKSLDLRYYYSSKALYMVNFFKAYTESVIPFIMSANGKAKKALILDCDNTLWKGILGEDGFDHIEMSTNTKDGLIFHEIQSIVLALNQGGVLIGLCSKNNPEDVDEVIKSHEDMQLRDRHITLNKSNWSDKVSNLKEMAEELNIGLDSFVIVDDSPFEVNLIKKELPEVTVLQVPEKLYEYPRMLQENVGLFYNLASSSEDLKKTEMYRQQVKRGTVKKSFTDIEDYLASLELKITVFQDNESIIPRMAQMSQKTNQFNLTTKRYTEGDIRKFVENDHFTVYAFSLSDRFGDSGVTGLCIIQFDVKSGLADVDTFLMSCRIIGRNIEYAFIDFLLYSLQKRKVKTVTAKYIRMQKNEQVKDYYKKCSFNLVKETSSTREYTLDLTKYESKPIGYIQIQNGK